MCNRPKILCYWTNATGMTHFKITCRQIVLLRRSDFWKYVYNVMFCSTHRALAVLNCHTHVTDLLKKVLTSHSECNVGSRCLSACLPVICHFARLSVGSPKLLNWLNFVLGMRKKMCWRICCGTSSWQILQVGRVTAVINQEFHPKIRYGVHWSLFWIVFFELT